MSKTHKDLVQFKAKQDTKAPKPRKHGARYKREQVQKREWKSGLEYRLGKDDWALLHRVANACVQRVVEMTHFLSNLDNSPLLSGLDTQVGHSTPAPLLALSTLASLL